MDAVEYLKAYKRMCRNYPDCINCPLLNVKNKCDAIFSSSMLSLDELVETVRQWAIEHPTKTRQSEFLKMFPNASTLPGGALECKPCLLDKNFLATRNCGYGCNNCRDDYWRGEVK